MESEDKKFEVLVADTTAFIQNAQLQDLAVKVATVVEVINEIKSKRQLSRLLVLPYDLVVMDVFPESVKAIRDFSIKTGDYKSLSTTDLKVLALTYQLEKEKVGTDHIRVEPVQQLPTVVSQKPKGFDGNLPGFYTPHTGVKEQEGWVHVPGFYVPHNDVRRRNRVNQESSEDVEKEEEDEEEKDIDEGENEKEASDDDGWTKVKDRKLKNKMAEPMRHHLPTFVAEESEDSEHEKESQEEDDDDDSDGGEWLTPDTDQKFNNQTGWSSSQLEDKQVKVACMTTDYAMQNVLKQMNLNLAALDGRVIRDLRIFVFRCYACFKITRKMTLRFCPKCGNETLKKVATSLGDDGKLIVHINPRKRMTAKGKRTLGSMPRFKGGKHPNNPVIVADQPMPDNKPSRIAKTKTDVFADNYLGSLSGFSPFAVRDTGSRSAMINFRADKGTRRNNRK